MHGSCPCFGQSSDLTSDCRSGQLVKAGRSPYFASRRYSVDRAIPRRRAACVRLDAAPEGSLDYRRGEASHLLIVSYTTIPSVLPINTLLPSSGAMHLDVSNEETLALLNLLTQTIENDRYPLSPRVQTLRGILAKFGPMASTPPPPRPPTPEERDPSRRPRSRSRRDR